MISQPVFSFSLFSTALRDFENFRPVQSLMLSSHLVLCLPCLLPHFTVPCKMVLARSDERQTSSSSSSSSNPWPRGLLGRNRWFCNQFSPFFHVLHCSLGLAELQACSFPDVVFLPLPLSTLSSSPFHCALQDGFGQTWWTGDMTIPFMIICK